MILPRNATSLYHRSTRGGKTKIRNFVFFLRRFTRGENSTNESFFNEIAGFETSSRPYLLLKYGGARRHCSVVLVATQENT